MAGMKEELGDFPHFSAFLQHLSSSSFLRGALTNIDTLYIKYGRDYLRLGENIFNRHEEAWRKFSLRVRGIHV